MVRKMLLALLIAACAGATPAHANGRASDAAVYSTIKKHFVFYRENFCKKRAVLNDLNIADSRLRLCLDEYTNEVPYTGECREISAGNNRSKLKPAKPAVSAMPNAAGLAAAGIVGVRINHMPRDVAEKFFTVVTELFGELRAWNMPLNGVIVDLRGNRGGRVNPTLAVASMFASDANRVLITEEQQDKTGRKRKDVTPLSLARKGVYRYTSRDGKLGLLAGVPVVVLVNARTFSAGEVLTAAMGQFPNVHILGTKTFGKAVATVNYCIGKRQVRVTVARYGQKKNGEFVSWHHEGITPTHPTTKNATIAARAILLIQQHNSSRKEKQP